MVNELTGSDKRYSSDEMFNSLRYLNQNIMYSSTALSFGTSLFFHWHYSPLWALACQTLSVHFFLSAINSLHLLTPSTWRSSSTSSFHLFLGLPLLLVSFSSWVKMFLDILSSSILSRWPNQLILCPFIHFTIFSPLLIFYSSRFVRFFHFPFSYLGPYIPLNIFLSKISTAFFSFFVNVHASAPYDTTGLISVLYNIILVALDKSRLLKRLIAAKYVLLPAKIRLCISFSTLLSLLISVPKYMNSATPS